MASPNCIRLQGPVAAEAERHPAFAATVCEAMTAEEAKLAVYLHAVSLRGLFGADPDVAGVDQAAALYLDGYAA